MYQGSVSNVANIHLNLYCHCRAHKHTRCVVERGIGQLKRRFHVLHGEIRVSPAKTSQIVMVCAALHNLCKERNLQLPDQEDIGLQQEEQPEERNLNEHPLPGRAQDGLFYRDRFANLHFQLVLLFISSNLS